MPRYSDKEKGAAGCFCNACMNNDHGCCLTPERCLVQNEEIEEENAAMRREDK